MMAAVLMDVIMVTLVKGASTNVLLTAQMKHADKIMEIAYLVVSMVIMELIVS